MTKKQYIFRLFFGGIASIFFFFSFGLLYGLILTFLLEIILFGTL